MRQRTLVLQAARDVIAAGFWTRGASARNAFGQSVETNCPSACKFCIVGAIDAAAQVIEGATPWPLVASQATREVSATLPNESLFDFNDWQRSKRPVLKLLDQTIARLESGQEARSTPR